MKPIDLITNPALRGTGYPTKENEDYEIYEELVENLLPAGQDRLKSGK